MMATATAMLDKHRPSIRSTDITSAAAPEDVHQSAASVSGRGQQRQEQQRRNGRMRSAAAAWLGIVLTATAAAAILEASYSFSPARSASSLMVRWMARTRSNATATATTLVDEASDESRTTNARGRALRRRRRRRRAAESQIPTPPSPPSRRSASDRHAVWLLSFPNSGTSYTIANTQHITNTSAASNYGRDIPTDDLVRIRPDIEHSPFVLKPERTVPDLVLTKTHCDGFCDDCRALLVSLDEFVAGCSESHSSRSDRHAYDARAVVAKAVHLFRDPFDNLVSRKHLGVEIRQRDSGRWTDPESSVIATDTPEGLLAWCRYVDESAIGRATGWSNLPAEVRDLFRSTPCASDLFRYVQWHNRAIEATRALQLPVRYVHYEDYSDAYEDTVTDLLDFLDLNLTSDGFAAALPFQAGKSYRGLFRHKNFSLTAMTAFLRRFATNETWQHLRRYVADDWYYGGEEGDEEDENEEPPAQTESRVNK